MTKRKRIEEPKHLENLRWRPVGLNADEQADHAKQLQEQREEDELTAKATEGLAAKTLPKEK